MGSNEKSYGHRPRKEATQRNNEKQSCSVARDIWRRGARRSSVGHGSVGGTCGKRRHPRPNTRMCWRGLQPFIATELFILSQRSNLIMTGELHASSQID